MGIGNNKLVRSMFSGAFAAVLLFAPLPAEAFERHSGIWHVLRAGHFSGPMNERAHVLPIKGVIATKDKRYRFWEYTWENGGHGGSGLLVFEQKKKNLSYIGCYRIDLDDFHGPVHPEVHGKTLFFPFRDIQILGDKHSFAISFENGPTGPIRLIGRVRAGSSMGYATHHGGNWHGG